MYEGTASAIILWVIYFPVLDARDW